jgi:hypothetical protein
MKILLAEPRDTGWAIVDLAGRDQIPGVTFQQKRDAVAAIRAIVGASRGELVLCGKHWPAPVFGAVIAAVLRSPADALH